MSVALRLAPLSPSCTEHELVARVRHGEDRAFEELYSRYRKRIAAYVLGMVGDHGRAEDITQEVFISALRRMRETERPIAFKPWIYEIAKNACIDNSRRARRGQEVPLDGDDGPGGSLIPFGSPTLELAVEAKQQLDDLCGAFGCLSESHHKILVMRELEGLSYKEIGERMGMSRVMVESTLFRARRRLGEEYEELVSGRRCQQVQAIVCDSDTPSLGIRERRRLARHLAHCQPCRRHARLAGFDDSALKPASLAGKIAALLPFPLIRLRGRGAPRDVAGVSKLQSPVVARSADALTRLADPAAGSIGLGRAAAAVAAAALAGAGGGLLTLAPGTAPRARHALAPVRAHTPGTAGGPHAVTAGVSRGGGASAHNGPLPATGGGGAQGAKLLFSRATTSGGASALGSSGPGVPHQLGKTPATGSLTAGSPLDAATAPTAALPGGHLPPLGKVSVPTPTAVNPIPPLKVPSVPKLDTPTPPPAPVVSKLPLSRRR